MTFKNSILKNKSHEFSIGEMYCGPGGIGLAAKLSKIKVSSVTYKFKHKWATDYHEDSCATYSLNLLNEKNYKNVICEDIKNINIKSLPYCDGFLYGFPCNDFSNVGETKGLDGDFGALYSYGVDYINHFNPKFIFAENVSGLSNANDGTAFGRILSELAKAGDFGYDLSCNLYRFEDYGIPQTRHRYIIIGFRNDLKLKFKVPKPSYTVKSCSSAILKPPIPKNAANQELTNQSKLVQERLKKIKPGNNVWNSDLPSHLRLNVKGAKLSMIYKRLDPNKPSYTVTGSGGGGTHIYHWKDPRALTNRERARLQTFPDDFKFSGSKESVRRQIGMAVPVDGAKIILTSILKTFAKIDYDFIEPNINIDNLINDKQYFFKF